MKSRRVQSMPINELANALASMGNGRPVEGLAIADRHSGLWGLPIREDFWPESMPPQFSDAQPRTWLARLMAWVERFGRRTRHGKPASDARFEEVLCACHLELTGRNLRKLTPLFAPFWHEIPAAMATVSHKAVAWDLLLGAIRRQGPGAALPKDPRAAKQIMPRPMYQLSGVDPLGDLLSVHWGVEELLVDAAIAMKLRAMPGNSRRLAGGLRNRRFLLAYPALVEAAQAGGIARRWLTVIERLVEQSPLTRLVYADMVLRKASLDTPDDQASEAMRVTEGLVSRIALEGALLKPLFAGGGDAQWWRDMWYSQLARTLVAVMCSAAAEFERGEYAKQEYQKEFARLGPVRRALALRHPGSDLSRWAAAEKLCGELAWHQPLLRLVELLSVFRAAGEGAGRAYLQTRFLDMLLRFLAVDEQETLRAAWAASAKRDPDSTVPVGVQLTARRQQLMRSEQSPLVRALLRCLLGQEWDHVQQWMAVMCPAPAGTAPAASGAAQRPFDPRRWLKGEIEALLDPKAAVLAQDANLVAGLSKAGVPQHSAADLWETFFEPQRGITPLVPGLQETREPPLDLLGAWRPLIEARM